jgi:Cft2 family RNA processing exonuclease
LYVRGVINQRRRQRSQRQEPNYNNINDDDDDDFSLVPPIYATFPTVKMGQMTLYDFHANLSLDGTKPPYTLEEMDRAFTYLRTIKYSQTLLLPNPQQQQQRRRRHTNDNPRLAVTAYHAGHVVGGSFLVFRRLQDETSVVFTASTYHIAKELHLEASTLLKYGSTPDVLVTHPGGPACPLIGQLYQKQIIPRTPLVTQAQRNLTNHVLSVLRRDGNILLPVDASGRALELILLLHNFWDRQRLPGSYNLIWYGSMVHNTIEFARSQLEWMNGQLGNQFDNSHRGGAHPYALRDVQICTNLTELEKIMSNGDPSCVLASGLDLDHGPARDLLLRWGDNDNNAVVFTDSSQCCKRQLSRAARTRMAAAAAASSGDAAQQGLVGIDESTGGGTAAASAVGGPSATISQVGNVIVSEEVAAAAAHETGLIGAGADGDEEDADVGALISEEEASKYTTAYQLLNYWCQAKLEDREMDDFVEVDVLVPQRRPLAGPELKLFMEQEEAARRAQRKQEEEEAMLREVELAKGRLRLGEDGGQASAGKGVESAVPAPVAHLPFARSKKKSRFDSSLFLKFSKPLHLTFEVREDAVGVGQQDLTTRFGIGESLGASEVVEDDYGIAVQADRFVDIVTGVDPSKFAGGSGRIGEEVTRRGLGYGASGGDELGKKRRADGDDDEEGDEIDERGLEAADLSEGRGIIRGRNGRPPTKVSTVNRRLKIFAEIDYIPLEGRVDAQAARQSVRALQPRQVIVLGGTKSTESDMDVEETTEEKSVVLSVDEVKILADAARGFVTSHKAVLTPSDGETIQLDVGHAAYSARLIATPYRTREEKEQEVSPPEPIELYETQIGACTVSLLDYVGTGQKVALDGSIVLAPRSSTSKLPAIYVSDGEVLLTDLRTELIAQGMKAEYSTHSGYAQLIINGKIVVKKMSETGKVDVEGPLCEDFFTVRSIVCSQYVVL